MKTRKRDETSPTRSERLREGSRQRRDQEKQELRGAILKTAADLFLETGYDKFSLRQVAERIGYSPGTIYLYYENKEDLLFAVADAGYREFGARLQAASDSASHPMERMIAIGRAYLTFGLENPAYYRLMFVEHPEFLQKPRRESGQWIETLHIWQRAVDNAMSAGAIRSGDTAATADTFWALLHGAIMLADSIPTFDAARIEKIGGVMLELMTGLKPE